MNEAVARQKGQPAQDMPKDADVGTNLDLGELPDYVNEDEDDDWIEHDTDTESIPDEGDRASSRTLSPGPISPAFSAHRLRIFERTFQSIVFGLGVESIDEVVKTVNAWIGGATVFRTGEAIAALRVMEEDGRVKLWDGKVFMPETYYMVGR